MKKTIKTIKEKINIPLLKSVIGEDKYNQEVRAELLSGAAPTEAPELVARRIAREQSR